MPFKKGESGNPGGVPADLLFRAALHRALKRKDPKTKAIQLDRIASQLITEAASGNVQAIKEIADRIDGKAHQSVGVDGTMRLIGLREVLSDLNER